jgi:hypothetical protein
VAEIKALSAPTKLSKTEESRFQKDYSNLVQSLGSSLAPNPDDPLHFYDYRGAWKAKKLKPGPNSHFPSEFKMPGHPNRFVDGVDTITGNPANELDILLNLLANQVIGGGGF